MDSRKKAVGHKSTYRKKNRGKEQMTSKKPLLASRRGEKFVFGKNLGGKKRFLKMGVVSRPMMWKK